jgi:hypothetical protein
VCRVIVFVALLMGLGVLFGTQALVVDLGYGMAQHGAMQNAADAGALAAGRLMAGSVSLDTTNKAVYALSDNQVHQQVATLAGANFTGQWVTMPRVPTAADSGYLPGTHWLNTLTGAEFELTTISPVTWTRPTATHQIAVQYLPCPGQSSGTPNFSATSDADLVGDIAAQQGIVGTRQTPARANDLGIGSAPDWSWSNPICMLRVWTRESHPPLLASAIGRTTDEQELAQATVRIAPTTPPSVFTDVWPITHYDDPKKPDPPCAFEINGCDLPFWDSQGIGNFKMLVDMSRYSALGGSGTREQLFAPNLTGTPRLDRNCPSLALFHFAPCYDSTWAGTHDKQTDLEHWLANGWNGQLYLPNESDPKCTDPARIVQECPNSRLEVFGGDLGNNVAQPMNDYVANHFDSIDPTCNCQSATVTVFFWRYGEQSINQTTNIGSVWNGGNGNSIQRIIVEKVRRFRFNRSTIHSSSVSGYFVGFYSDSPPQAGPPGSVANTVVLVG